MTETITIAIILTLVYLVYQSYNINSRFKKIEGLLDPSTRKDSTDKSIYIGTRNDRKELTFSDIDDKNEQLLLILQLVKNQNWDYKVDNSRYLMGSSELVFTDSTGYKELTIRFYTQDKSAYVTTCKFTSISSKPRISINLTSDSTPIDIHKTIIDFAMDCIEVKRNKEIDDADAKLRAQRESMKEILKDHYRDKKLDELL